MASVTGRIQIIFDGAVRGVTEAAARVRAAVLTVEVEGDKLKQTAAKVGDASLSMLKALAKIGVVGNLAPVIAGMVSTLGSLVPGLLLVPGAIAAIGAVVATVKIGLSGFSDALGGDAEALAKLAPSARATVQALQGMSGAFDQVKRSVQEQLFDGFAASVKELGANYLPVLRTGLTGIAQPLNALGKGLLDALNTRDAVSDLQGIFDNVRASLGGLDTAAGDAATGFLKLAAFGSQYFGGLGDAIDGAAAKFKVFVSNGVETGSFNRALDEVGATLQQIGRIAGNVGDIVRSAFRALAGPEGASGFLDVLEQSTGALRDFAASAQGQGALSALGELFRTAGAAMRDIFLSALKALAPVVERVAPVLSRLSETLGTALAAAIDRLAADGTLDKLADSFVRVVDAVIPLIPQLAELATQVLPPLVTAVSTIGVPAFQALAAALGLALDTYIKMAAPFKQGAADFEALVNSISGFFSGLPAAVESGLGSLGATVQGAIDGVVGFFTDLGPRIGTAIGDLGTVVGEKASGIWTGFLAVLSTTFQPVLDFFSQTPRQMGEQIGNGIGDLISAGGRLIEGFRQGVETGTLTVINFVTGIPGRIGTALASLGATLVGIATSAWESFTGTARTKGEEAVTYVRGVPAKAGAALSSLPGILLGKAAEALTSFRNGITTGTDNAIAFVRGIPGRIAGAIGNLGGLLVGAGRAVIDGLLSGIKSAVQGVYDFVSGIAAGIAARKGPLPYDRVVLRPAGLALMAGLLGGLKAGNADVQAYVASIAAQLADGASGGVIASARALTAPTTVSGPGTVPLDGGPGSALPPLEVRVYIGDREIVDMIRVEVDAKDRATARAVRAGAGVG